MILLIFKNIGLDTKFMIVCNLEGSLCGIFSLYRGGHFENGAIKWGWGAGKIEPQYFRLIWPLRKPKKQWNQFWQKLFNFRHFSDITHQTIYGYNGRPTGNHTRCNKHWNKALYSWFQLLSWSLEIQIQYLQELVLNMSPDELNYKDRK